MDTQAHRKSRAPWQDARPRGYTRTADSLAVPPTAEARSRRQTRRLLIHASAMATKNLDTGTLPPLPIYRSVSNNSDIQPEGDDLVATMRRELQNTDARGIADFHAALVTQKRTLERELADKINQNQKNILELTGSLQTTQEALVAMRTRTRELYSILDTFTEAAHRRLALEDKDVPTPKDTHKTRVRDRLLVMVLEKMWVLELQLLYKHVDGAQKYVPPVPGRHVLAESGRWHEVNVATWKPTRSIHVFLLNDAVLVATRKLDGGGKRLHAIYCWPLHLVEIADTPAPANTKMYAIDVQCNGLSHVYQTDRYDHFLRIMSAYAKGKAELTARERDAVPDRRSALNAPGTPGGAFATLSSGVYGSGEDQKQLRDSFRDSLRDSVHSMEDVRASRNSADMLLQDLSARVHQRNRSHDFKPDADTRLFGDLKTSEDRLDEVDVHLAHNEYTAAVGLLSHIEERVDGVAARMGLGPDAAEVRLLVDVVRLKIASRKTKVQQGLLFDMHHRIATLAPEDIRAMVEFFALLDQLVAGVAVWLDAMSGLLAQTVGKLVAAAHGATRVDIVNHIANLAVVHVLVVRRAVALHRECVEPVMRRHEGADASGFVTWCVAQIELLVEAIERHAAGTLLLRHGDMWVVRDQRYYNELVEVVERQLALLRKEGLEVDYLFEGILHCQPLSVSLG